MPTIMTSEPRILWDLKADLGEGPVWVERDAALWFVDIKRQKIYRFDPESGAERDWHAPEKVGFVLPARSGGFVAGLQSGLHHFDPASGAFSLIVEVDPDLPDNRLNDGVVDAKGRIWFGTMDNGERARNGAFYCFDGGELKRTSLTGIAITNGPAVSPDGNRLYWVDTIPGTISACDIAPSGELGPSREIVRIPPKEGHPDGPTVDSEGCIWIGIYSGGKRGAIRQTASCWNGCASRFRTSPRPPSAARTSKPPSRPRRGTSSVPMRSPNSRSPAGFSPLSLGSPASPRH
jgi:Gluconolactonase